jgi:hypothetical protein
LPQDGVTEPAGTASAAVAMLRQKAPEWNWSLQCLAAEESAAFQAVVAECSGNAAMGSLALCAAMLRAFARRGLPGMAVDASHRRK